MSPVDPLPPGVDGLRSDGGGGPTVVDLDTTTFTPRVIDELAAVPAVVIGTTERPDAHVDSITDVVVPPGEAEGIVAAVEAHPIAATSLALLLRGSARRSVADGIIAESATYSLLQAGPEFATWLQGRPERRARDDVDEPDEPLRLERSGSTLRITLHRPHVRNALDTSMRDALLDALAIAEADPELTIELAGDGPCFSSGGDLDEFGTFADPASAHLVRVARSVGRVLAGLADRTTAMVHGTCIGSGIELPAFAGRVVAQPDATFALPEIGLGLVPGAGGTVSLPRRIGRHRTCWLGITGHSIDATTALAWGLVDEIRST